MDLKAGLSESQPALGDATLPAVASAEQFSWKLRPTLRMLTLETLGRGTA